MSFSESCSILPSFFNHHEIEFCRQLLLNQIPNALLFFDAKSKIIHDFLIKLLKLPGSDPIRDARIIIFKWSCRCFYNKMKRPIANPSVPLDFSFVHPELVNFDILYSYVSKENLIDNFFRLNDTFPYELFKVISMMKPENAQIFAAACGFNSKMPIHMSGRIISIFPLSIVTIDFSQIFKKRCYKSYDNFIYFFEGLLCNADFNLTQITAAQMLSDHFDDLLIERSNDKTTHDANNQCLQLINTSIRKMQHFIDNNFALSMHLFQSQFTTLSFLIQTSAAPLSTLSKASKKLPPSEYITRFNNQMKLMQVVGLGEDWKKFENHSLPFLIGPNQLSLVPVILVDIPRSSRFLTLRSSDYQKDYDFIHAFLVINEMIKDQKLASQDSIESLLMVSDSLFSSKSEDSFFSDITTDLFSLLFLKKKNSGVNYDVSKNDYYDILGRRKSNSMSLFTDLISSNSNFLLSKSESTNYLMKSSSSEFVFDAETAFSVVSILHRSGKASKNLQSYLTKALIRIRCAMSLFERPVRLEAVLLPHNYFYLHALTSLDLLEMLIKSFEDDPPSFVKSRQFALSVSRSLFLRDKSAAIMISTAGDDNDIIISSKTDSITYNKSGKIIRNNSNSYFNPFSDRLSNAKPLNHRTEEIFNEVLNQFPLELHSLLLLDFVSSHKKFTVLAKNNKDIKYDLFVKKMLTKSQRYPHGSILDLYKSKSLTDLQKKLCSILSFGVSNNKSILTTWCAFLFLLTSIPSQSYSKFFKDPIENQIIDVINNDESIQSAVERFTDTRIDVFKIIFNKKNSKLLKEKFILELIKFEPLLGIPFSLDTTSVDKKKIIDVITKNEDFKFVVKFLKNESNLNSIKSNKDTLNILDEKDKNKFKKTFEEKIDEIIHEDKVLLLLEKLNSNTNKSSEFQEKSMLILDYLIFKVNLSPYFEIILSIVSHFPKEWSIQFIETFVSFIDPSNEMALFPLQQQLSELKPKLDFSQMTEELKIRSSWDYLIKEVTRFKKVVQNPEKFYRFCSIHLMSQEVGQSLITLVQSFTQILLFVRNYEIFTIDKNEQKFDVDDVDFVYSFEQEDLWIKKYLKYGISSLNESILAEMTIDIGLNYCYECGLSISNYFNMKLRNQSSSESNFDIKNSPSLLVNSKTCSSISDSIKKKLPLSINLIKYANDPKKLAEEILSEQVVNTVDEEKLLLHLLVNMKKFDFITNLPLYGILNAFTHNYVFLRFGIPYNGKSLTDLRDVAEFCDLLNNNERDFVEGSFESLLNCIEISDFARKKLDDCYSIFGLLQSRSTMTKKLIFTSSQIDFNCETYLNEAMNSLRHKLRTERKKQKELIISSSNANNSNDTKDNNNDDNDNSNNNDDNDNNNSNNNDNDSNTNANANNNNNSNNNDDNDNNDNSNDNASNTTNDNANTNTTNNEVSINDVICSINNDSFQSFKNPSFSLPNIFSLSANSNSLMIYFDPIQQQTNDSSTLTFFPDFKFFDIDCKNEKGESQLRISSDSNASITETIAFSETKMINNQKKKEFFCRINQNADLNDFALLNALNKAVVDSSVFDLFDSLKFDEMKRILVFANERSLIYLLLQITIWVQEHQDYLKIFVFPGSALESRPKIKKEESTHLTMSISSVFSNSKVILNENEKKNNNKNNENEKINKNNEIEYGKFNENDIAKFNEINENNDADDGMLPSCSAGKAVNCHDDSLNEIDLAKILDFVLALKFTLINAMKIADEVDPSSLFSPSIIKSGVRKNLDDLCLAIEHQIQIGVKNLNLFEETASTGNVAHVIAQVFVNYSNDYDRGFALARVFHADIDEVMIEAAALVAMKEKNSEEQLVQFLLAVLPRLDSNSSNQLIQALSSILVRNASNEHFLKLIISGIKNPQSTYQMLRCFGYSEQARDFALLNDLGDEVELSMKDSSKRGIKYAMRICNRWILQHKQQTS